MFRKLICFSITSFFVLSPTSFCNTEDDASILALNSIPPSDLGKNFEIKEEFIKKAENGCARTQATLGCYYFKGIGTPVDKKKAIEWLTEAANQEFANAQYNLGLCYERDEGVDRDVDMAVNLYRKSALQNNKEAQYSLGFCYQYGIGVRINIQKAYKWFAIAAENGMKLAQMKLKELDVLKKQTLN